MKNQCDKSLKYPLIIKNPREASEFPRNFQNSTFVKQKKEIKQNFA